MVERVEQGVKKETWRWRLGHTLLEADKSGQGALPFLSLPPVNPGRGKGSG